MDDSAGCEHVEALVDALAGGEAAGPAVEAHLRACPSCAAALEVARRIDWALRTREAPRAPATFTAAVLVRLSRERWRSEQFLDWGFNIAIVAGIVLIVGGVWLLLNVSGLTALASDVSIALGASRTVLVSEVRTALPTYGLAMMLVVATLGVWWWADRRVSI